MCSSDQVDVTNPVKILWGLKTVNSGSLRYSEVLNLLLIQLFFFFYSFLDLCIQGFTCATPLPFSVSSSTTCDTSSFVLRATLVLVNSFNSLTQVNTGNASC